MTTSLPARSQRKHTAILSAGRELFLAQGYRGTSVEQIAAAAGVSKQTVYKHFGEKHALLMAIVNDVVGGMVTPVTERIAALARTDDLEGDLVALASEYLRSVLAEPVVQLRRLVIAEAGRVPELAAEYYDRAPEQTLRALADAFNHLGVNGLLDVPEPRVAAEHFAALIVGRSIDRALFFGASSTLADLVVENYVHTGVEVFLASYQAGQRGGREDRQAPQKSRQNRR